MTEQASRGDIAAVILSPTGILFRDKKGIDAQDDTAMDDGEAVTSKDDSISELGQLILKAEVGRPVFLWSFSSVIQESPKTFLFYQELLNS